MTRREIPFVCNDAIYYLEKSLSVRLGTDLPKGLGDYLLMLERRIEQLEARADNNGDRRKR